VREGAVVIRLQHGLANLENGSSIDPNTHFHAASLAKQFTALAVLQLRDAGNADLDDSMASYLPEFQADLSCRWQGNRAFCSTKRAGRLSPAEGGGEVPDASTTSEDAGGLAAQWPCLK
jgi:Beta-lactamase